MKFIYFLSLANSCFAGPIYSFWSYQALQNPGSSPVNNIVTGEVTRSTWSGYGRGLSSNAGGGALGSGGTTFTAFDQSTWVGSGGTSYPGCSTGFSRVANVLPENYADIALYVTLTTHHVTNLRIRFDVRSAQNGGAQNLTAFTGISYRTTFDEHIPWTPITANLSFPGATNAFGQYSVDLSDVPGIYDRTPLRLRFSIGQMPANTSVIIDNVQVSAIAYTTFADWEVHHSVIGGPKGVPFNDSISNLQKYAFNLPPTAAAQGANRHLIAGTGTKGLPAHRVQEINGDRRLALEYVRRKAAPDLTYLPRFSTDFSDWSIAPESSTVTSIDDDWERVVALSPVSNGKLFGRVSVSIPGSP